jgi:mono/diheme cytochrome c family protein
VGVRPVTAVLGILCTAPSCGGSGGDARVGQTSAPSVRYDQHVAAGSVAPPADSMTNPLAADSSSAAEGERLFIAMNCDGCHGGGATGWVAPSLVDGRWRYGGDDGALYHSIFYGRPRGMPAYGGMLSPTTIWQIVAYLRSLPVPAEVPTLAWP